MSFETFTPIWSHVDEKGNKLAKIQKLKFRNPLNNFDKRPSIGIHDSFGSESHVYFQRRWCLKFFLPYSPMLRKTKKKIVFLLTEP